MKTIVILLILIIFSSSTLKAQDEIFLKNGDKIKVKILEILPDNVLYKNFKRLNGPTFSILRADIDSIKFGKGKNEFLNLEKKNNVLSNCIYQQDEYPNGIIYSNKRLMEILKSDSASSVDFKKYKKLDNVIMTIRPISAVIILLGVITTKGYLHLNNQSQFSNHFGITYYDYKNELITSIIITGVGVGIFLATIPLDFYKQNHFKKAIRNYNAKFNCQNKNKPRLDVGLIPHGIGFKIKF